MDVDVIRRFVLLVGLLAAVSSCSRLDAGAETVDPASAEAAPATATAMPSRWAQEAVDFFEALSGFHPDDTAAFYGPSAFIVGTFFTPHLESREAIQEYRKTTYPWEESVRQVFLSKDRAIVDMPVDDWLLDELRIFEVSDSRIVTETRGDRIQHWSERDPTTEAAERLQTLYTSYLVAWDSGDRAQVAALYQPGAVATDGLFGGPVRIRSDGGELGPQPETLLGRGARYQPVRISRITDAHNAIATSASAVPALYSPGPRAASPETRREAVDLLVAYAMFDVSVDGGCELRLVAEWQLQNGLIADEEIFYDVASLRRCLDARGLDRPEGWWSGLKVPDPLGETVTSTAAAWDGAVVEIVNGSPAQHELVRWALERFQTARLVSPRVATIAFPPTKLCSGSQDGAFALVHPTAARVDICLGEDNVCPDSTCATVNPYARRSLLHELGHVWEHQNVDDDTRQAFLDNRGLLAWADSEAPWNERGNEQAAEAIAWGLMDHPFTTMIPNASPEELSAGFHLLTGTEPIHTR